MREARISPQRSVLRPREEPPVVPVVPLRAQRQRSEILLGSAVKVMCCVAGWHLAAGGARAQEPPRPERAKLRNVVYTLASPEMAGRRGEGARKTAEFLVAEFQRLKLEPMFDGRMVQEIPGPEPGSVRGRNVGGVLRGADPALRDEWVIVSAHFDHLGKRGDVIYPGADDNASGVAMMLEVARSLCGASSRPRRSVAFIGFDLEEAGLFGSRYFVAHPPVPLERISLFITADMIGRALAGICLTRVFVLGTEHAPGLRPWIEQAARGQPVTVGLLGSDLLLLNRSDYGPFRTRRVPYLFFSTGENPRYHSPDDRPETLDYDTLTAISRIIHGVVLTASNAPEVPRWNDSPDHPLAEAVTIRDVIRKLIESREALKLGGAQLFVMNQTLSTLEEIIARGAITPAERASMIQAARLVLLMVR
jgi:hypothetical protein